jgi:N-acetylmuramic acid 6-phosphate etherase
MGTENISRRYAGLDAWEPADILDGLIEGQMSAVAAVRAVRREIETAALAVEERLRAGAGRLIYAGAGYVGPSGRAGRRRAPSDLQLAR